MNKTGISIIVVLLLMMVGGGMYLLGQRSSTDDYNAKQDLQDDTMTSDRMASTTDDDIQEDEDKPVESIGTSVNGNDIMAYHFGGGDKELLFIGGIHGGYGWNTVLLAYELIDYLKSTPTAVPEGVKVTVIPVLNPDGLETTVGTTDRFEKSDVPNDEAKLVAGRFNGNTVDLNRNFECDWQAEGVWRSQAVSGGDKAFSEPEAAAIRDYVQTTNPTAVVVWYSAAGGVFASNCHSGVLPETTTLTDLYAKASGYKAYAEFDFYEVTGDMVNWLAKESIPAISVLLTDHKNVEWSKNREGILAIFEHYSK